MGAEARKPDLIVGYPQGSPLVRDYLEAEKRAMAFYARHFAAMESYVEKAAEVDGRFDTRERREEAARALILPTGGDAQRLEEWIERGGYMVTTGQQPALFGGPLYNIYKALTVVSLANTLERALERPVLPVFWVGSEDHDWDEADHTVILGADNEPHAFRLPHPDPEHARSLHRIPMPEEVGLLRDEFLQLLPSSDFSGPYIKLLHENFVPGRTLAEAFHGVMEALLGPRGLYFTDAAHPVVKLASQELLFQELERSRELEEVLARTGKALTAAGYPHQVTLMEEGVNLFLEEDGRRQRIYRHGEGRFRLSGSETRLSGDEIRARAVADPAVLSPNVFLRPVVESHVFPTLAYVAGPGEAAYFAQIGDYFRAFAMEMPVVHPRFSVTVLEGKIRKVLVKFGLEVEDLHRPFHEIASEIAREEVPPEVRQALGALRGAVADGVAAVQKEVQAIDPTLKGPVQHVRSHAFDAINDLEKKVVHAVKRRSEIALSQLEKAQHHLYPDGKPQERVLNPFYYLFRFGGAFLDALQEEFTVDVGS